jgi:hypothetical protein
MVHGGVLRVVRRDDWQQERHRLKASGLLYLHVVRARVLGLGEYPWDIAAAMYVCAFDYGLASASGAPDGGFLVTYFGSVR